MIARFYMIGGVFKTSILPLSNYRRTPRMRIPVFLRIEAPLARLIRTRDKCILKCGTTSGGWSVWLMQKSI